MSNTRFINAWECQGDGCFNLYPTKRKAINCFNKCNEGIKLKGEVVKAILIKGHECLDCLKVHEKYMQGRTCCHTEPRESKDHENYDLIGLDALKGVSE